MNNIFILALILFSCITCFAEIPKERILAKINVNKLHLAKVLEEGNGTYSVIDNNRVVVAKGKELLIIKNNAITLKLKCPTKISAFDINKHGNGAIVSGGITSDILLYRIKAFKIAPRPIKLKLPEAKRGTFVYDIAMVDDTTIRFNLNDQDKIILADINRIENNRYDVLDDALSRFLSRHVTEYIGSYKNEYYFLECTARDGIERVTVINRDSIERRMSFPFEPHYDKELSIERMIELGDLGRAIPMSNNVRVDKSSGLFYVMLVQDDNLVIREFNIKDFAQ